MKNIRFKYGNLEAENPVLVLLRQTWHLIKYFYMQW